jgi:RHS repeat-associated protein
MRVGGLTPWPTARYQYALNALDTATLGNGVGVKWQNTAAGRTLSEAYALNGNVLHSYSVDYDNAGLVKAIARGTEVETMSYDKEGQLTGWRHGSDTTKWTLDARGNWTALWKNGAVADTRTFNGANGMSTRSENGTAQTVAQDDAGQLTQLGTERYTWTNDQKLSSANGSTIIYDGMGRMVRRIDGADVTDYLYDGWQVIREMRGSSSVDYTYGPRYIDEALAMHSTAGSYWYLRDQNMDVAGVTDASGSVVEKYSVGPYGDVKIANAQGNALVASSVGNTRFFQGLEMVDGLYANRYRWVSPQLGRYVSRDPMGFDAGDVNLFRWLGNDPVNRVDPYGYSSQYASYEQCQKWKNELEEAKSQMERLLNNYDRYRDYFGGDPIWKWVDGVKTFMGLTKPWGHYKAMLQRQAQMRKIANKMKSGKCDDDDDCRPPNEIVDIPDVNDLIERIIPQPSPDKAMTVLITIIGGGATVTPAITLLLMVAP